MQVQQIGTQSSTDFAREIVFMADEQLLAQDLVQQGAIHAISYLMSNGCTEDVAAMMLKSLRENSALLREEANRRGSPSLFQRDQTVFN